MHRLVPSHGRYAAVEEEEFDPRAFAEPVDVVAKIPGSFQSMLTSSKWKERKEALDELLGILNGAPRILEASDFGDISKSLALRVQGDANINCVMTAANCLEALAKGLGAPFGKYRETIVPLMLERMKERKASVTDVIGNALDAVFLTVSSSRHCGCNNDNSADKPRGYNSRYGTRFVFQEPSSKGRNAQILSSLPFLIQNTHTECSNKANGGNPHKPFGRLL